MPLDLQIRVAVVDIESLQLSYHTVFCCEKHESWIVSSAILVLRISVFKSYMSISWKTVFTRELVDVIFILKLFFEFCQ